MAFKIEYIMYSGNKYTEFVSSLFYVNKAILRTIRHIGDDANVERVKVLEINKIPLLDESVNELFLYEICFRI